MDYLTLERRLQAEIEAAFSNNKDVFSAVLGIGNTKGDFYWEGAAGTAYPDKAIAMMPTTPIFIASITKMYTSAATMILEEQDRLSLGDPISKFLPGTLLEGLHRYKGRDYTDQLRIYHLISQTSGLPDYFMESPRSEKSIFDLIVSGSDEEWDAEKVMAIVRKNLSAKFPPESRERETSGKKAYYSDTNYQLLGSVIEAAAQKPLHQILSEFVIEPLELASTYMHGHGGPVATGENPPANIYYKTQPLNLDKAMTSFGADGGMVSNVGDCLKFLRHFMQGKLFSQPTTLPRMKSWRRIFSPFQYGFGIMRFKLPRIFSPFSATPELVGHSGSTSAFLFYSELDQLYIGGTLNQIENQGRPVRLMLKMIKLVSEVVS
jgi:CubicO group peptidase (beta-lactamase class C family)